MNSFVLSCCSTLDLSPEHVAARDISYICFHYYMDGVAYADDLGQSMPFDTFYQKMVEGADTRTSQINMEEYIEYFEKFLTQGKDILHVTLSSGLKRYYRQEKHRYFSFDGGPWRSIEPSTAAMLYGILRELPEDL